MGNTAARPGASSTWSRDRRIWYRIPLRDLGCVAILRSATEPQSALVTRVIDLSAGGCCLVADATAAGRLETGADITVTFPVMTRGLRQPATLIASETHPDAPEDVLLRLHFRHTDSLTQQRLAEWLTVLAVQDAPAGR